MKDYFADFHVHIGINEQGKWIKIPTSRNLTVRNITTEAVQRKGMDIVGIVDAMSPSVLDDLGRLIEEGNLELLAGGGYRFENKVTILLGAEIETAETDGGLAHTLIFLPDMETMRHFSGFMSKHIRNIHMSSQNAHMPLEELIRSAAAYNAIIIPAHIFTPHKSLFGSCTGRISRILSDTSISAISAMELGLSADTSMADRIDELSAFSFITNSDAHSLDKIAREYNIIQLEEANFEECRLALARKRGRGLVANYGLNPKLGKYHRTCCAKCGGQLTPEDGRHECLNCGSKRMVRGVLDRIDEIADRQVPIHPAYRPPYYYQIPLEFIPGIGGKTLSKLLLRFGTEMNVIHHASDDELFEFLGAKLAAQLIMARTGKADIINGGGGIYGRLSKM